MTLTPITSYPLWRLRRMLQGGLRHRHDPDLGSLFRLMAREALAELKRRRAN